jgi:hypothetical protein
VERTLKAPVVRELAERERDPAVRASIEQGRHAPIPPPKEDDRLARHDHPDRLLPTDALRKLDGSPNVREAMKHGALSSLLLDQLIYKIALGCRCASFISMNIPCTVELDDTITL